MSTTRNKRPTRELHGEEIIIRDIDGDALLIYQGEEGIRIGTQRAGEEDGFAVILDLPRLDRTIDVLVRVRGKIAKS